MQLFCDALSDCSLEDLGFVGDQFTWRRGRIRERLDRVVGNQRLSDIFPNMSVLHDEFNKSDHRPILIDTEYLGGLQYSGPIGLHRFEARWLREESVDSIVEAAWERTKSRPGATVAQATSEVNKSLH